MRHKYPGEAWRTNLVLEHQKRYISSPPPALGSPINTFHIEAVKFAEKELSKYTKSWTDHTWDELDWARVKELQVRDILDQRQAQADIAQSCHSLKCPNFLKHVSGAVFVCMARADSFLAV